MTARDLARAHFAGDVPALLAEQSVVALVPADPADSWAADTAWAFARAAAQNRRVALVDVTLEVRALDSGARQPPVEGLVDAFEFGSSLSHVAQEQSPGLFFIPVGTAASDPHVVRAHPRWQRLSRGFASQDALLLLYVPAEALRDLALVPDGIVILARHGAADMAIGAPVLATVGEDASPPPKPRDGTWRPVLMGAGAVLGLGVTAFLVLSMLPAPSSPALTAEPEPPPKPTLHPPPAAPPIAAGTPRTPAAPTGDSLHYSLQIAAFRQRAQAIQLAAELATARYPASIVPVTSGRPAARWFRVVAGAHATSAATAALRRDLWSGGILPRGQGIIVRTPHAYALGDYATRAEAEDRVRGLRDRGLPTYIVAGANGTLRVLFGAFEHTDQARAADSLLAAAGVPGTLVSRIGIPE